MKKTTTPILTALAPVALSAISAGAINLSGGTISLVSGETIYVNNASDTMGSVFLSAAGNLTIAGPGAWSLSGGGPLNITAGILTAGNTSGGDFVTLATLPTRRIASSLITTGIVDAWTSAFTDTKTP